MIGLAREAHLSSNVVHRWLVKNFPPLNDVGIDRQHTQRLSFTPALVGKLITWDCSALHQESTTRSIQSPRVLRRLLVPRRGSCVPRPASPGDGSEAGQCGQEDPQEGRGHVLRVW